MKVWLYLLLLGALSASSDLVELPKFGDKINNVTGPLGREATLKCIVDDLSTYKVAWLRVDTQTILTIHSHVITKNHRIAVSHDDHRTWNLHIRDLKESDRGWYMCQINTDPMKSLVGFLDVVVPPDILDYPTSTDMVVREGSNVSLRCAASGSPAPNITWKRENGKIIPLGNGTEVTSVDGPWLNMTRVNRMHMGPYFCIASNGYPPSVSKRIMLIVNFPPMIYIRNQLIEAYIGQQLTLECISEAFPSSINYWSKGDAISYGTKTEPAAYKALMKLPIKSVGPNDFGAYKCVSRNSLGETDGTIKVYRRPRDEDKYRISIRKKNRHDPDYLHKLLGLEDKDEHRTSRRPKTKNFKNRHPSARKGSNYSNNETTSNVTRAGWDNTHVQDSNFDEDYEDDSHVNLTTKSHISIVTVTVYVVFGFLVS